MSWQAKSRRSPTIVACVGSAAVHASLMNVTRRLSVRAMIAAASADSVSKWWKSAASVRIKRDGRSARIAANVSVPSMSGTSPKYSPAIERRHLRFDSGDGLHALDLTFEQRPEVRGIAFVGDPFPNVRANVGGARRDARAQRVRDRREERHAGQVGRSDHRWRHVAEWSFNSCGTKRRPEGAARRSR